jgi:hypothetical protein
MPACMTGYVTKGDDGFTIHFEFFDRFGDYPVVKALDYRLDDFNEAEMLKESILEYGRHMVRDEKFQTNTGLSLAAHIKHILEDKGHTPL